MVYRRSVLKAFCVALPAAVALWIPLFFLHALIVHGPYRASLMLPYVLMGGILFGLPLVFLILLCIAIPAWSLLRSTVGVTLPRTLVAGAACGLLARELARHSWGQPELSFLPVSVVLLAGTGTAWVWWNAWSGPPDSSATHRGAV